RPDFQHLGGRHLFLTGCVVPETSRRGESGSAQHFVSSARHTLLKAATDLLRFPYCGDHRLDLVRADRSRRGPLLAGSGRGLRRLVVDWRTGHGLVHGDSPLGRADLEPRAVDGVDSRGRSLLAALGAFRIAPVTWPPTIL